MDLQIDDIERDSLHSSLKMTHRVLEELGLNSQTAAERVARFGTFDEEWLKEQHQGYDDQSALIEDGQQAR